MTIVSASTGFLDKSFLCRNIGRSNRTGSAALMLSWTVCYLVSHIYRKYVLHRLKDRFAVYLSIYSTDLRSSLGHCTTYTLTPYTLWNYKQFESQVKLSSGPCCGGIILIRACTGRVVGLLLSHQNPLPPHVRINRPSPLIFR